MKIALFCHSLLSDWNHGNAHFLRGVSRELIGLGHTVKAFEPRNAWSLENLVREHGEAPLQRFREIYPQLDITQYDLPSLNLSTELNDVDLVLAHEWNHPELIWRLGIHRRRTPRMRLLFHDTHHRAISNPKAMSAFDLSGFDGVLAFGQVIRDIYLQRGWCRRAWTWHEAADIRVFHPQSSHHHEGDLVWIGNWGDGERTEELSTFLLKPAAALSLRAQVHGVRYPESAVKALARHGIRYSGWLPNYQVPHVFCRFRVTVHVPRRQYAQSLPGIPTIRPFEALACGIPMVSAPWQDRENLFTPEQDYLVARTGREMTEQILKLLQEPAFAASIAAHGLQTVRSRHTCAHRAEELLQICEELEATAESHHPSLTA